MLTLWEMTNPCSNVPVPKRAERNFLLHLLFTDPHKLGRRWDCHFPKAGCSFTQRRSRAMPDVCTWQCSGEQASMPGWDIIHSLTLPDDVQHYSLSLALGEARGKLETSEQLAAWLCQHCVTGEGGRGVKNRPAVEKKILFPFSINLHCLPPLLCWLAKKRGLKRKYSVLSKGHANSRAACMAATPGEGCPRQGCCYQ